MKLKKLGRDSEGDYFLDVPLRRGYERRKVNPFPVTLPEEHRIITHSSNENPNIKDITNILSKCYSNYLGMPITAYYPEIIEVKDGKTKTKISFFWLTADFF